MKDIFGPIWSGMLFGVGLAIGFVLVIAALDLLGPAFS